MGNVPEEKLWRILRTCHRCARSFPITVKIAFCERLQNDEDELEDDEYVMADVCVGETPYVYVLERDFVALFRRQDVDASILQQLDEINLVTYIS